MNSFAKRLRFYEIPGCEGELEALSDSAVVKMLETNYRLFTSGANKNLAIESADIESTIETLAILSACSRNLAGEGDWT